MDNFRSDASRVNTSESTAHKLLWCLPILAYSGLAYSQDQTTSDQNDSYRVNAITVYGQNYANDADTTVAKELWVGGKVATSVADTPALISVMTEKEIAQRNATTTEEVLQYSAGILTDYYGTDDRNDYFKIRGYNATTYRDGMTLGSMRSVREDPYAYERVEVIRGGNSTLFGPAEPGGSVNFVSKKPKFERFGNSYVSYGSFDHKQLGVDFGDTLNQDETFAYRLTAKVQDSDLEYDHSKNDAHMILAGLTWQPSLDTTATLLVDYLNRDGTANSGGYPFDKEYDRSDYFGDPNHNQHDVERTNISAQLAHYFENGLKLSANVRYSDLDDDYGYLYISDNEGRTGTVVDRAYLGSETSAEELIGNTVLQYDTSFERVDSSTLVGLEYRDASTQTSSLYTDGSGGVSPIDVANPVNSTGSLSVPAYANNDRDYKTTSIFLQQNLSLDDRYILTFGVRHDYLDLSDNNILSSARSSDDFSETSFRAALTYKVSDEWSTYISQVESVAPPTIGVTPERGEQLEFGVKYAPTSFNGLFSAAVYDLKKDDVTMAVVKSNGDIEQETVGKTRVRGLDLEFKAELTEDFNLTGNYAYMESEVVSGSITQYTPAATVVSIEDNEFTETPNHSASLWGYYTLPNKTMDVGLGARYIGSYYFNAENTKKSEAATLLDAAFAYRFTKDASLSVNVHNLTDEQHVVGSGTADFYNPGRSFNASVSYAW
ncbi:TonB-dependent siderophore receptor [Vibrio sp. AK197]